MARNLSVEQFKQLMERLPKEVAQEMRGGMREAGEYLANGMRQAVPRGIDGCNELLESIRVEPGRRELQVYVKAGGDLTSKEVRKGSGVTYDYAIANEFGTSEMAAQPFFWPSYRLLKRRVRSLVQRRMTKAIKRVVPLK